MQATVARSLVFTGVGLHGGAPARMVIRPAASGEGIRFHRVDVVDRDPIVPARYDAVFDARLCTVIRNADDVSVSTVEHVMAALAGMGVDNALVTIDGPEAPILDGSAKSFVDAIMRVGLSYQAAPRRALRVLKTVRVEHGLASAALSPAPAPVVSFDIDFADAAIGRQSCSFAVTPQAFAGELADCRTFVRRADIDALRAAGLALGGGLHNAVVVDGAAVLNPEGLRRADEFVRHKALDAVGDLALAGGPVLGAYHGVRAGHAMTNALLRALFADRSAWRWEPAAARADAPPAQAPERLAAE